MKNFIQPGDLLTITTTSPYTAGAPVAIDSLFGVAAHTAQKGEPLTIATQGVFELPKTDEEIKLGMLVRFDKGKITIAATGIQVGIAVEDASAPAKTVKVKLK